MNRIFDSFLAMHFSIIETAFVLFQGLVELEGSRRWPLRLEVALCLRNLFKIII